MARYPILLLASCLSFSAHAQELPSRTVSHADLDLSKKSDVVRLKIRVRDAVDAVCGYRWQDSNSMSPDVMRCRRETRALTAPRLAAALQVGSTRWASREITIAKR